MRNSWFVPGWPAPAQVRAVCTTRGESSGDGASRGSYRFFNLGDHVGDDSAAVSANRARLERAIGARPVFLQQVHATHVLTLEPGTPNGVVADAALTTTTGLACTIMVADCLPILLTNDRGSCVAALHAGWRGLAGGVIEATLARFTTLAAQPAASTRGKSASGMTMAWLGPCIGPSAFEVGTDVYDAFVGIDSESADCFAPAGAGKFLADLAGLARLRLRRAGVAEIYGNDSTSAWCTVNNEARFFSYRGARRRNEKAGRFAACIWRA